MRRVVNIHAGCVLLARAGAAFGAPRDAGILLLGKSGAGKSDLALRLVARGAVLVSDDRTDLFAERGILFARAPESLRGLIEVRGLGIVALPSAAKARVALAVSLDGAGARLPEAEFHESRFRLSRAVPLIRLAPFEAAAPEKVALAAAAFQHHLFRSNAGARSS
jgi:serine kinase of HPr protein (carbohydrate metabolism regulator)